VALIDQPRADQQARVNELQQYLGDRLIILPAPSLEEYVPMEIYEAAGLDKNACLHRIEEAQGFAAERDLKEEISTALAKALTTDLLERVPEILRAARLAAEV